MKNDLRNVFVLALGMALLETSSFAKQGTFQPNYNPPTPVFSNPTAITNPYLPLESLKQDILEGKEAGKLFRIERTRQTGTKSFTVGASKVEAMIVEDKVFVEGKLHEIALDYFAQSDDGTVYYLGENVDNYKDGKVVNHDGTWLYGIHTKQLGVMMPAKPAVGDKFRSEDAPNITREDDEVISVSETVTIAAGTYKNCIKIKEILSDGEIEYKFYAPKVGVVKEQPADGQVELKSHN